MTAMAGEDENIDPMADEPSGVDEPAETPEDLGPNRRCIVTGTVRPAEGMIRFVISPDGVVTPDLARRLPGRGIWLSAERDMVNTASAKNLFSKAARRKVSVPADLADRVEQLLARRCQELLGLARRAGQVLVGFEKVRGELKGRRGAVLVAAADGAVDGREKIRALAPGLPLIDVLRSDELGAAMGREHAVHAVLAAGRLAAQLMVESGRLAGFRKT